ncbi:MAG: DUF4136 domain-containing protein [Cyclobacteriaceae bacterium]|nr:DUF4136 domain-containing protein [Cyclobacteriaceae bacterium]
MNLLKKLSVLVLGTIALSCSSIKTTYDYDRAVDFVRYKTYGFTQEARAIPVNELVSKRVLSGIRKSMEGKGLRESDNPDLLVDLGIKTETKQQTTATSANFSGFYGRRWSVGTGFSSTQFNTTDYTEGTLVISLVDAATQALVWVGQGTSTVTEKTTQQHKLEAGIEKILKRFPPKK